MIAYSEDDGFFEIENKINIRDYFAAKALDFSLREVRLVGIVNIEEIEIAVNLAYKIADAMMKERNDS